MARLRATLARSVAKLGPKVTWQGPLGAVGVVAGIYQLAGQGWATLTAGGLLIVAAAFASLEGR